MSDYSKAVNFAAKDALLTGNPNKVIKGTEHNVEYDAIAVAIATKVDTAGTGTSVAAKAVSIDLASLSAVDAEDLDTDDVYLVEVDGTPKKLPIASAGYIVDTESSATRAMLAVDANKVINLTYAGNITYTLNTTVAHAGAVIILNSGSGSITVDEGTATLESALRSGDQTVTAAGMAVLIAITATSWKITGDIV